MRNISFNEKIILFKRNEKKRITRNALRGAASPLSQEDARQLFEFVTDYYEKVSIFNDNIGSLFPLILDMVASGCSLRRIEKSLSLTPRFLWRWLECRERLAQAVREARRIRRGSVVLGDWDNEAP